MPKIRYTLQLNEETHDYLKQRAYHKGVSMSAYINDLLYDDMLDWKDELHFMIKEREKRLKHVSLSDDDFGV